MNLEDAKKLPTGTLVSAGEEKFPFIAAYVDSCGRQFALVEYPYGEKVGGFMSQFVRRDRLDRSIADDLHVLWLPLSDVYAASECAETGRPNEQIVAPPATCSACGSSNSYSAPANRGNKFVCGSCRAWGR